MYVSNLSLICVNLKEGNIEDRLAGEPISSEYLDRARVLYLRGEYKEAHDSYVTFANSDYMPIQDAKDFAACCTEIAKTQTDYRIAGAYYRKSLSFLYRSMMALARNNMQPFIKEFEERYIDSLIGISYACINGNENDIGELPANKFNRNRTGMDYLRTAILHFENLKDGDSNLGDRIGKLSSDTVFKLTTFGNSLLLNSENARSILKESKKHQHVTDTGWFDNIYGKN